MAARVATLAFEGVEARRVEVEAQFTTGDYALIVVGLGDKAVAESKERVRAAFVGLGLAMPGKRIIVNLAPADLPKMGSHYDLPIEQLGVATDTAARQLRPYVFITGDDSADEHEPLPREGRLTLKLKNFGQTPARNVRIARGVIPARRPLPDVDVELLEPEQITGLGPGASVALYFGLGGRPGPELPRRRRLAGKDRRPRRAGPRAALPRR